RWSGGEAQMLAGSHWLSEAVVEPENTMSRKQLISRRKVLRGGAASSLAALGPFFHSNKARADKGEIVVASWGGSRTSAMREVLFKRLGPAAGIRGRGEGPPRAAAKVKAQADGGNITWDVLDTDIPAILTMAKNNLLWPIDYAKLDKGKLDKIPKVLHHEYGLGHLIYGFNIVYNTKTFPTGQ